MPPRYMIVTVETRETTAYTLFCLNPLTELLHHDAAADLAMFDKQARRITIRPAGAKKIIIDFPLSVRVEPVDSPTATQPETKDPQQ